MNEWFQKQTLRERALLIFFLFALLLWWLFGISKRLEATWHAHKQIEVQRAFQKLWLGKMDVIQERFDAFIQGKNWQRMYTKEGFLDKVDSLLRVTGLKYRIEEPKTIPGAVFKEHRVELTISGISLGALIKLEDALLEHFPYVQVRSMRLSAQEKKPEFLEAALSVSSIELSDELLKSVRDDV